MSRWEGESTPHYSTKIGLTVWTKPKRSPYFKGPWLNQTAANNRCRYTNPNDGIPAVRACRGYQLRSRPPGDERDEVVAKALRRRLSTSTDSSQAQAGTRMAPQYGGFSISTRNRNPLSLDPSRVTVATPSTPDRRS